MKAKGIQQLPKNDPLVNKLMQKDPFGHTYIVWVQDDITRSVSLSSVSEFRAHMNRDRKISKSTQDALIDILDSALKTGKTVCIKHK